MKARIAGREVGLDIEGRVRSGIIEHASTGMQVSRTSGAARLTTNRKAERSRVRTSGDGSTPSSAPPSFTFTLQGQLPSGKNSIKTTRTGRRYPTGRFATWRDAAVGEVHQQSATWRKPIFRKPASLEIEVHYAAGDLQRRDIPGMLDALFHVLERANIVEDDAQIRESHWYELPLDRERPHVRVIVRGKP